MLTAAIPPYWLYLDAENKRRRDERRIKAEIEKLTPKPVDLRDHSTRLKDMRYSMAATILNNSMDEVPQAALFKRLVEALGD